MVRKHQNKDMLSKVQRIHNTIKSKNKKEYPLLNEIDKLLENLERAIKQNNTPEAKKYIEQLKKTKETAEKDLSQEIKEVIQEIEQDLNELEMAINSDKKGEQNTIDINTKQKIVQYIYNFIKSHPRLSLVIGGSLIEGAKRIRRKIKQIFQRKKENAKMTRRESIKSRGYSLFVSRLSITGILSIAGTPKTDRENNHNQETEPQGKAQDSPHSTYFPAFRENNDIHEEESLSPEIYEEEDLSNMLNVYNTNEHCAIIHSDHSVDLFGNDTYTHTIHMENMQAYLAHQEEEKLKNKLSVTEYGKYTLLAELVYARSETARQNALQRRNTQRKTDLLNASTTALQLLQDLHNNIIQSDGNNVGSTLEQGIREIQEHILDVEDRNFTDVFDYKDMEKAFSCITKLKLNNSQDISEQEIDIRKTRVTMLGHLRDGWASSMREHGNSQLVAQVLLNDIERYENNDKIKNFFQVYQDPSTLQSLIKIDKKTDDCNETLSQLLYKQQYNACNKIQKKMIHILTKNIQSIQEKTESYTSSIEEQFEKDFTTQYPDIATNTHTQQKLLDIYNTTYDKQENDRKCAKQNMKDIYVQSTKHALFLQKTRDMLLLRILANEKDENLGPEAKMYKDIMGVGRSIADHNKKRVTEFAINIGLMLVPIGAGVVASKLSLSLAKGIAQALRIQKAFSYISKMKIIQGLQRAKLVLLIQKIRLGKRGIEGIGFYEGYNMVDNIIKDNPIFQGRDNKKEIIASIALIGYFSGIGKTIFKKISTNLRKYNISNISPLQKVSKMLTQAGFDAFSIMGINTGIDISFQNDVQRSRAEYFQCLVAGFLLQGSFSSGTHPKTQKQTIQCKKTSSGSIFIASQNLMRKIERHIPGEHKHYMGYLMKKTIVPTLERSIKHLPDGKTMKIFGCTVTKTDNTRSVQLTKGTREKIKRKIEKMKTGQSIVTPHGYTITKTNQKFTIQGPQKGNKQEKNHKKLVRRLQKKQDFVNYENVTQALSLNPVISSRISFSTMMRDIFRIHRESVNGRFSTPSGKQYLKKRCKKNTLSHEGKTYTITRNSKKKRFDFVDKKSGKQISPSDIKALDIMLAEQIVKLLHNTRKAHPLREKPFFKGGRQELVENLPPHIANKMLSALKSQYTSASQIPMKEWYKMLDKVTNITPKTITQTIRNHKKSIARIRTAYMLYQEIQEGFQHSTFSGIGNIAYYGTIGKIFGFLNRMGMGALTAGYFFDQHRIETGGLRSKLPSPQSLLPSRSTRTQMLLKTKDHADRQDTR